MTGKHIVIASEAKQSSGIVASRLTKYGLPRLFEPRNDIKSVVLRKFNPIYPCNNVKPVVSHPVIASEAKQSSRIVTLRLTKYGLPRLFEPRNDKKPHANPNVFTLAMTGKHIVIASVSEAIQWNCDFKIDQVWIATALRASQ